MGGSYFFGVLLRIGKIFGVYMNVLLFFFVDKRKYMITLDACCVSHQKSWTCLRMLKWTKSQAAI